jgi:hypothetical protein
MKMYSISLIAQFLDLRPPTGGKVWEAVEEQDESLQAKALVQDEIRNSPNFYDEI